MHVSCDSGYQTECKKDYDVYTCVGDKGAPANKIVLKECTSELNRYVQFCWELLLLIRFMYHYYLIVIVYLNSLPTDIVILFSLKL